MQTVDPNDSPTSLTALRGKILGDIRTRDEWLRRQAEWYAMRHDGLRRGAKPWPAASDLHFPLVDSIVERLKPFYFNQLFATETLASFISLSRDLDAFTGEIGCWFDYKLKQESNLETEILIAIDYMLMSGMDVIKVFWDPAADSARPSSKGAVRFDAMQPSHVIVPHWTKNLQEADRVTFVQVLSVEQYRRDPRWPNKDEAFIQSIAGKGSAMDGTNRQLSELEERREGLTYSSSDDEIIYWEVWERTVREPSTDILRQNLHNLQDGTETETHSPDKTHTVRSTQTELQQSAHPVSHKTHPVNPVNPVNPVQTPDDGSAWIVHWISPMTPEPLRASMRNPFKHGRLPAVRIEVEVKDKGHYSSRGIPERAGDFEISLSKLWNEKSDYMTLCNRPIFTSQTPIPNAGNLRLVPGQIIAGGLSAVQMPPPPVSFEEEMMQHRSVAEQLIGMPDYGQGASNGIAEARTATEVQQVSALMNVSVDLKARTFRKSLGELYRLAWETLVQFDQCTQYFVGAEVRELSPETITAIQAQPGALSIQPNGSADSWNKQAQMQKAIARKQLLGQSPWINQPELDKSILELDDPRLVKRLFIGPAATQPAQGGGGAPPLPNPDSTNIPAASATDPRAASMREAKSEAGEIPALMLGIPLPVSPEEDHAARIQCLESFMRRQAAAGSPAPPAALAAMHAHLGSHLAALHQRDPAKAQQIATRLASHTSPQSQLPNP